MLSWVRRHELLVFFALAYTLSWVIAVPLALQEEGVIARVLPLQAHYLTAWGPGLAALLVSRVSRVRIPRRAPTRMRWLVTGFAAPLLLFAIAQLVSAMAGRAVPQWQVLGNVNFLPPLGIGAWVLWLLTNGLGEELGWRSFALPRVQARRSALTSSALVAVAWAGWHLPAFFYVPTYRAIGPKILPGFFLGILAGSIVLTWLYNSSRGSVAAVVLWHTSFNFVSAAPEAGVLVGAVSSTAVIIWAIAIVIRCGTRNLSAAGKEVREPAILASPGLV